MEKLPLLKMTLSIVNGKLPIKMQLLKLKFLSEKFSVLYIVSYRRNVVFFYLYITNTLFRQTELNIVVQEYRAKYVNEKKDYILHILKLLITSFYRKSSITDPRKKHLKFQLRIY